MSPAPYRARPASSWLVHPTGKQGPYRTSFFLMPPATALTLKPSAVRKTLLVAILTKVHSPANVQVCWYRRQEAHDRVQRYMEETHAHARP